MKQIDKPMAAAIFAIASISALGAWLSPWPSFQSADAVKATTDWWTIRGVWITALIAAGQFVMFYLQLGAMRRGLKDAAHAAKAATDQAAIAQKTFDSVQRPYVLIHKVSLPDLSSGQVEAIDRYGEYPCVTYSVASAGKLPAIIDRVLIGYGFEHDPTIRGPSEDFPTTKIMQSGEQIEIVMSIPPPEGEEFKVIQVSKDGDAVAAPISGNGIFYLWVVVQYHGPFTSGHITSGCWIYLSNKNAFLEYHGEEMNYMR